ncbi:hypothetical protein AB0911_30485 [Streptomyces nigra]|uniref:hypothetical protein n=1 Tax=Streptomyces nigra TaxID=1827580 RepID=UPI003454BE32
MTRFARILCAIYGTTTAFLAWATTMSALADSTWPVLLFAAASVVPVIAWLREIEFAEAKAAARADMERGARVREREERRSLREAADALQHACCERWWTSLGTDHDPKCEKQRRAA